VEDAGREDGVRTRLDRRWEVLGGPGPAGRDDRDADLASHGPDEFQIEAGAFRQFVPGLLPAG